MRALLGLLLLSPLTLAAAAVSGASGVGEADAAVLAKGALRLGDVTHAWNQLAWYHRGRADAPLQPHAVVTAAGERYAGRVVSWDGRVLRFAADPAQSARIELAAEDLAALELQPTTGVILPQELPALLRRGGPPVPGRLSRLARDAVEVTGPLGAFAFDHDQVRSYLWRVAEPTADDQVILVGGIRLHGQAAIAGEHLVIDHPRLGRLQLPLDAVQEIRRRRAGVHWLSGAQQVHRHRGALGDVPAPRALDPHDPAAGLHVVSDSVLSWPAVGGTLVLRAAAGTEPVGLVVAVDKKPVGKLVLQPGEVRTWHQRVPEGKRLLLAIKGLGPRPAVLELRAPHIVEGR